MADDTITRPLDSSLTDVSDEPGPRPERPLASGGDRYQLDEEIARGGMGIIYRATDTVLNREVAVKVLQENFRPTSFAARRFLEEARITGQLQHPAIPAIHDLGTLPDGRQFLVMKLIQGRTLDDHIAERRGQTSHPSPDSPHLLAVFEQTCHAVAFAHSRRVIHRDLKPANVMVGSFGEVQVMDWGLAKVLGSREPEWSPDESSGVSDDPTATKAYAPAIQPPRAGMDVTQAGSVLGTPAFMSPEQAIGANDRVDERSDVFCLGGILCAILTGRPPYVSSNSESSRQLAAMAKLEDARSRLQVCGADPELVALCQRCLAPEKSARPADAAEVARAVAELRTETEARLRRAELDRVKAEGEAALAVATAAEQRKKRRVQLALALAVAVIGMVTAGFGWWVDHQAGERKAEREQAQREKEAHALRHQLEEQQRTAEVQTRTANNRAALLAWVEQCRKALETGRADAAGAALDEINRRFPDGGGEELTDQVTQFRTDLALLRELDAIDQFRWIPVEGRLPAPRVVAARWQTALASAGLDPRAIPPAEAAARIRRSSIRVRLLAALDLLYLASSDRESLGVVLGLVDPDPFREEVRAAVRDRDLARIARLGERPEALQQPPGFAAGLGQLLAIPRERRRAILEAALRSQPASGELLMALGDTWSDGTEAGADERLRWYQAAIAADPQNVAAHVHVGVALLHKGRHTESIAQFRTALRLSPNYARVHINLGLALALSGDVDAAILCFREAVRLDPQLALAHQNLSAALRDKGDLAGAIAAAKEAVRLDPGDPFTHKALGLSLAKAGDWDGAIAAYRIALQLDPGAAEVYFAIGNAQMGKQDWPAAVAAFREAIRLKPDYGEALNNLGNTLAKMGDGKGAVAAYREAIRVNPKLPQAHHNLGMALEKQGDTAGALAAYKEAVRLNPKSAPHLTSLANALMNRGDVPAAMALYREAIRLDPKYAPAHCNLGVALAVTGDNNGALAAFQEAIRCDPSYAPAHNNLGVALVMRRDFDGAVAAFAEAVRLDPSNDEYRADLANARKQKAARDARLPVAPPPRPVQR